MNWLTTAYLHPKVLFLKTFKLWFLNRSQSPVYAGGKVRGSLLTSLEIRESVNLGSLTCHVLRDTSQVVQDIIESLTRRPGYYLVVFIFQPLFDYFVANSSTRFGSPGTYDPYAYGKRTRRSQRCDVYLRDDPKASFFQQRSPPDIDLEIVLILQPLLGRNGKNVCDVSAKYAIRNFQ